MTSPAMLLLLITIFHITTAENNCRPLTGGNKGYITYGTSQTPNGSFESGTVAYLRCYTGYYPTGSTISWCYDGRWSPSGLGNCVWYNNFFSSTSPTTPAFTGGCPVAGTPTNGTIQYSNGMSFGPVPNGTTAQLKCHDGHNVEGVASMTCINGRWDPDQFGVCKTNVSYGSNCPFFSAPDGAEITYTINVTEITLWTTASMKCLSGEAVLGTSYSTCLSTGWHPPQLGTCPNTTAGRECQRLPQRVGAEIIYTPSLWRENVTEGTNATLKCRDYEHVVGASFTRCMNKTWNPLELGKCSPATGTGTSTCVSGAWHPQSVGECSNTPSLDTPKLCHPLNAPYNGTVSLSKGSPDFPAENGVVAMLVCKPGTFVLGSTTSLCTGGTWIPSTLGTCNSNANSGGVETGCNWMFAPHGMFLNWSNINFGGPILNGTQLTANCVNSANNMTCVNGLWQPTRFGTCGGFPGWAAGASCPPMTASSPDVGLIYRSGNRYMLGAAQDKLDHGTLLTVKCYNGTMRGNNVATCADGKWYPSTIGGCFR